MVRRLEVQVHLLDGLEGQAQSHAQALGRLSPLQPHLQFALDLAHEKSWCT